MDSHSMVAKGMYLGYVYLVSIARERPLGMVSGRLSLAGLHSTLVYASRRGPVPRTHCQDCSHGGGAEEGVGGGGGVGDLLRARDCTRHHLPRGCPVAPSWPLQSVPRGQ